MNFLAEVLRRPLTCCMSIKAKIVESGDLEDGDLELPEEEEDEEGLIRCYVFRGFEYNEIRLFLFKTHGILKRRIKPYGLRRRRPDYDIDDESILSIINGLGCLQGYRSVWHTLQLRGKRVPCIVVQELLREIDPEGSELRTTH